MTNPQPQSSELEQMALDNAVAFAKKTLETHDPPQSVWQEFEAKYKISEKYTPHEQIIYMAFEAGHAASNREAAIKPLQEIMDWYTEAKIEPYGGAIIDKVEAELRQLTEKKG